MAIYTVRTSDGCGFEMVYDPAHPRSPICIYVGPGEPQWWTTMPYQAADARDARHAAELVQEFLDDGASVETVERYEDANNG